ncbi:MAG: hypothetical protein Q9161_000987 [Pseudevernia consocians]
MDVSTVKKNVSISTPQANPVIIDRAADKTRCQGIAKLYVDFADDHVQRYEKKGKANKISRAKIELQLLKALNDAEFPIEYKLSWSHAVLASANFNAYWIEIAKRHKFPESCFMRYITDKSLLEYEVPIDDEAENEAEEEIDDEVDDGVGDEDHDEIHDEATAGKKTSPTSVSQTPALVTDHGSRSSSPDCSDGGYSTDNSENWPQILEMARAPVKRVIPSCERCGKKGLITRFCSCLENEDDSNIAGPSNHISEVEKGHEAKMLDKSARALDEDPPAVSGDLIGLAREEEQDDSGYEESPPKNKGKGKAKPTVKDASKPKGIMKNKAAPKNKEQTPAQLKTAAAKTQEPAKSKAAKPEATKKAATTPSQGAIPPVHAPFNGSNNRSQAPTVPDELDQKIAQVQEKFAPAQAAGIKRMMEQYPEDDEDDSPAKKAKIGGAASANGGRKKATPKTSNQKKDAFKEWDGIPRGFGED